MPVTTGKNVVLSHAHEDAAAQRISLRNLASAFGLMAVGLLMTGIVVLYAKVDAENSAHKEFDFTTEEVRNNVVARLRACTQILQSSAAFFDASASVDRRGWQVFTQGLRLEQQVPGIQGVGFAQFISDAQLADHVQSIRREGFPDYQVRPAGDRESYSAIIYLEPFTGRNLRAFGYDMLSEPVRRAAMERARDEHAVALSGKVVLVQETNEDVQAGTLMYFPVYRHGMPLQTIAQRRAALTGWVYSPYRMADLLRGSLMGWEMRLRDQRVSFQVYDGNVVSADALLFDNQSARDKTRASSAQDSRLVTVDFAGRRWTLRFSQIGGLAAMADYRTAWFAFFGGTVVSLLLFWLTLSLLGTRANAQQMAGQLTQKLRQSTERLALATHTGGVGIWDYDVVNNRLVWDDQMFRLYGTTREQFSGAYEAWRAGVHPEDRKRGDEEIQQALQSEKEFDTEFRVLWPDSRIRYIRAHGVVQRDASGQPARMIGTNWDITEIKQALAAQEDSARYARNLIEVNLDPLVTISANGKITDVNEASVHVTGVPRNQLIGTDFSDYFTEPEKARIGYRRVFAEGFVRDYPLAIRHAAGHVTNVLYNASVYRDSTGRVLGVFASARDITERLTQQQKLQALLAQTEQDARTKGELLKEVNHRVTNNLTAVLGLLVHEKEFASGSEHSSLAPVLDRLQQRIRGLLQVHRMLAHSAWAPVRLDKLAEEIIRAALSAAPWRQQAVVTVKPSALKVSPRQAGGLALVLNELTTNTVKYAGQPSQVVTIGLEAESHEEWTTIYYRDSGPGYPADVVAGQRTNIGLKLINEIVTKTLRGSLVLANDQGAVAIIRIQLEDENRT